MSKGRNRGKAPIKHPQREKPDLYTGETPLQSAHRAWANVQKDLIYALGANVHRAWTGQLEVSDACPETVSLHAPSRFIANKIENSYNVTLTRLWQKHDLVVPPRQIIIVATYNKLAAASGKHHARSVDTHSTRELAPDVQPYSGRAMNSDNLRERFTFDNFVVGPSNEFAYAAARQVLGEIAPSYNPIVIHGQNGMGKTHLIYALMQAIEAQNDKRKVRLLSAEAFVTDFIRSVRKGGRGDMDNFKASLRNMDVLIVDDIHFIADKPGSQEEFLHTLVALVDSGRQIFMTSDCHPSQIEKASVRLQSYLSSGLVCKIDSADYDLRRRIVDRLIARRNHLGQAKLAIPQKARDLLAAKINATPRDLEGAFNQVVAQSEFLGTSISLESIQDSLADSRYAMGQRLSVDKIQRMIATEFHIGLDDMISKRRAREIARPRQIAMYFCKKFTKRSLPDIGRRFGGRDHTTVMHAVKRIENLRLEDEEFHAHMNSLEKRLKP